MKYSMKTIWKARDLILRGYSVAQVAVETGMAKSAVYSYTKWERNKMKENV